MFINNLKIFTSDTGLRLEVEISVINVLLASVGDGLVVLVSYTCVVVTDLSFTLFVQRVVVYL